MFCEVAAMLGNAAAILCEVAAMPGTAAANARQSCRDARQGDVRHGCREVRRGVPVTVIFDPLYLAATVGGLIGAASVWVTSGFFVFDAG